MTAWAHRAARFAGAAARECSADSERSDAAHPAQNPWSRSAARFVQRVSAHRQGPRASAAAVPIKSVPAWAQALVWPVSPYLFARASGSKAQEPMEFPVQESEKPVPPVYAESPEPVHERWEPLASRAEPTVPHVVKGPHAVVVSTAAKTVQSIMAASVAEPNAQARPGRLPS